MIPGLIIYKILNNLILININMIKKYIIQIKKIKKI